MHLEDIHSYHAHLYYLDQQGLATAKDVARRLSGYFNVSVGHFHERTVGPHPAWSVQITFAAVDFAKVIPWLMLNRDGLDVFFHPVTGDQLFDHTQGVGWLGNAHKLDIRQFLNRN